LEQAGDFDLIRDGHRASYRDHSRCPAELRPATGLAAGCLCRCERHYGRHASRAVFSEEEIATRRRRAHHAAHRDGGRVTTTFDYIRPGGAPRQLRTVCSSPTLSTTRMGIACGSPQVRRRTRRPMREDRLQSYSGVTYTWTNGRSNHLRQHWDHFARRGNLKVSQPDGRRSLRHRPCRPPNNKEDEWYGRQALGL
jgi:hypothetical protein